MAIVGNMVSMLNINSHIIGNIRRKMKMQYLWLCCYSFLKMERIHVFFMIKISNIFSLENIKYDVIYIFSNKTLFFKLNEIEWLLHKYMGSFSL
jgi:hypothetical protein